MIFSAFDASRPPAKSITALAASAAYILRPSHAFCQLLSVASNHTPDALVVSLGVDAAGVDPESPLEVSTDGFHGAGERLAALRLPTVLVHEGGYELARLGVDTVAVLSAFGSGES